MNVSLYGIVIWTIAYEKPYPHFQGWNLESIFGLAICVKVTKAEWGGQLCSTSDLQMEVVTEPQQRGDDACV